MKVVKENESTVQIQFDLEEYLRIIEWLTGKEAGEIDLKTRDALENFIGMEIFLNPKHIDKLKETIFNKS